jgi:leucyl aminopeptidase
MKVRFTVSAADLDVARGDLLAVLLDEKLEYAVTKRCRLRPEAEKWLKAAEDKKLLDHMYTAGEGVKFGTVAFLALPLEAFQEPEDQVRTAAAKALDYARNRNLRKVAFVLETKAGAGLAAQIVDAAVFGLYEFTEYRKSRYQFAEMQVELLVPKDTVAAVRRTVKERQAVVEAANDARTLVNITGSELPPERIAAAAKKVAAKHKLQFTLLRKADLEREKFTGILNVGAGSAHPPVMFALKHSGGKGAAIDLALVGKGVTFDTGGISLKPWDKMWEMKGDMAGAAAVIGVMQALAALGVKKNIVGIVPAAENRPDAKAYLPGDVLRYRNGVTVEIHSTDAEGRLILADGLIWAQEKFKAKTVIDIATLTGACVRALGMDITGVMGNDAKLVQSLISAGARSGEKMWELPLPVEYKEMLLSTVADIKNVGGALAGASTAGLFLQRFIEDGVKWAHLDIAGTFETDKRKRYFLGAGGTGVMVRTLVELARTLN